MAKYLQGPISTSDGRTGTQRVLVDGDGTRTLTEIHLTRDAEGRRINDVYNRRACPDARVWSFGALHGVTWALTGPEREIGGGS